MSEDERFALRGFIQLLMRSDDIGDGWRNVSDRLRKFVTGKVAEHPDLYETRELDGLQIRLTERGKIVKDYV